MPDDIAYSQNEITNPGQGGSDLFERLKVWFTSARDHSKDWRKQAEEDYAFSASEQYTQDEMAILRDQLRPALAFNRVLPVLKSVAGYEVQNRQELRYLPRQMGQVGINEVITAAAKWFRDQSEAEDEESDAFLDTITCGMGWIETRPDYDDDPEGRPINDRIDPLEMYWDSVARKKNLADRRYQFRAKKYMIEDARDMFPDVDDDMLHAAWADDMPDADQPHRQNEAKFYKNDQSGKEVGDRVRKVLILQAQWWDWEQYYRVLDEKNGCITDMEASKYEALSAQMKKFGMKAPQAVKSRRKVYRQCFIGSEVLPDPKNPDGVKGSPYPRGFTINCITGERDRNKNIFFGLVRVMKDPQRWANKFLSAFIHQWSTSGKGLLAETDAVHSTRQFEEEWSRADAIKWAKPGAISNNKILELKGAEVNASLQFGLQFAISSIRDVTGVNIELMGLAEKDQPGILEYQRKQAGLTILAPMFDSLRRFRKTQGHVLLYYIQNYFSDGRLIKIDGEEGARYIPLIRDPNIAEYDVIVDEAPTSPNQKEHVWSMLVQMMPMLKGLTDPVILSELLKYSPLPESLTQKISQHMMQQAAQPPQPSPTDQAKIAQSQSAIARNIAGAIKDLSQAGVQGPGPEEEIKKQAVASLLESGQSAQDHGEAMQQQAAQQAHEKQMALLEHQNAMQQNAQQAALAPPPANQ